MRLQINFVIRKQSKLKIAVSFSFSIGTELSDVSCIKKVGQIDRFVVQWFVVAKSWWSGTSIDILLTLNYPMGETRIPMGKKISRK